MRVTRVLAAAVALICAVSVAGCSSKKSASGSTAQEAVTLTMWRPGDCGAPCPEDALIKAYKLKNPAVTIKLVVQPGDTYFATLKTASISKTGPDLATMWPGGYMKQFEPFMVNLAEKYVPKDLLKKSVSAQYFAKDSNIDTAAYAVPLAMQWYAAFYNKALFAKVGIAQAPTTWSELFADAAKLKAAGITPVLSGAEGGGSTMQPLYEWGYLSAALSLKEWNGLVDGSTPYASPKLVDQVTKWSKIVGTGLTNSSPATAPDADVKFREGKGAMLLGGGSWMIGDFEKAMGKDLGVFIPPYSDSAQRTVVEQAGQGYALMNYSKNQDAAGAFLAFILGDEGQKALATTGQVGSVSGYKTTSPVQNVLIAIGSDAKNTVVPMYDSFSQASVTDALVKNLNEAYAGTLDPQTALKNVDRVLAALPADQRQISYHLGG